MRIKFLGCEKEKMKTKNKMIASLEIAIVLCSMFLVALPAIAAEQNPEMHEMSASTITTASEDEFPDYTRSTLGIFGNANEDDTIDMRDLTYVKLIFFGKKPETELADAKYDGKINPLDFIQIKLIIVGKEKEITILTPEVKLPVMPSGVVTVHKPVKRIVVYGARTEAEVLRALNIGKDKIVGVDQYIMDDPLFYPELSKLPSAGSYFHPDYEAILNLNPDVLIDFMGGGYIDEKKLPGVTVIFLGTRFIEHYTGAVRKYGYIFDKREEAEELINWREGWISKIESRTEGLSEDEKPRVFFWVHFKPGGVYTAVCKGAAFYEMTVIAGGKNIAEDLEDCWIPKVDPEWVIEKNPDIIVAQAYPGYVPCGYSVDDLSEMAAAKEDIMKRIELANVNAVKTGNVFMMAIPPLGYGGAGSMGITYMAKWDHPELFEDLDPKAIHQEYLTRFQHLDYDLDEHGVFVYHPEKHPDGK